MCHQGWILKTSYSESDTSSCMFLSKYHLVHPFTETFPTCCEKTSWQTFSSPWNLLASFLTQTMLLPHEWGLPSLQTKNVALSSLVPSVLQAGLAGSDTRGWTWSQKATHCRWMAQCIGWSGLKPSRETSASLKVFQGSWVWERQELLSATDWFLNQGE